MLKAQEIEDALWETDDEWLSGPQDAVTEGDAAAFKNGCFYKL